jgi:hypothetical protein
MAKKQKSTKAGNSRKASKVPATARTPKAPRTRERDPRLPAAGTTLTREYKGKTIKVSVLEDGFRCDGKDYRSLSALASEICGNSSNGFLWFGLIGRKAATPGAAEEMAAAPTKKTRAPKVKRAGRDPQPAAATEPAAEPAPVAETATA